MNCFTYILYSRSIDKYYVGQAGDVENRVIQHNSRKNLGASDWVLKYKERFETRSEAMNRESEIKKKKRRSYIEKLIGDQQ